MKTHAITIAILATCAALRCALASTPAEDRLWATRVLCELQAASPASLPDLQWQQGTTPLLSLDQLRNGRAVDADTNAVAIVRFGPTATNTYFVTVTNYATSGNGYLVQMPTIGTNASGWWYTAYFERSGKRYWTGNGRLDIEATTSTEDGLVWQTIISTAETDPVWTAEKGDYATAASVVSATGALDVAISARGYTANAATLSGATNAALSVAATFAASGTVARATLADYATEAGSAAVLRRPGYGDYWVSLCGGTVTVWRVEESTNIVRLATFSGAYDGTPPTVGMLWYYAGAGEYVRSFTNAANGAFTEVVDEGGHTWSIRDVGFAFTGSFDLLVDQRPPYDAECSLEWGPVTNSYSLATLADLAELDFLSPQAVTNAATYLVSQHTAAADPHPQYALESALPGYGVTNNLAYFNFGASVTGVVFRVGASNIYLWAVQP